jgi:Uma2 family endonuclease
MSRSVPIEFRSKTFETRPGTALAYVVTIMSGMSGAGVKLTYEDFVLFPDDGKRHELIDGEHYVTPSPGTSHPRISGNLHWLIRSYLEQRPVGEVFYAPYDVVFSNVDVVEPDLLYLSRERAATVMTEKHVRGAPELVVEIASKGTRKRDETIKRRLYERSGVDEYWVVDPQLESIRVYRREGAAYGRAAELSCEQNDVLETSLLPGLRIPLALIFKA